MSTRGRTTHLHLDVGESGIGPSHEDGVQGREDSRSVPFLGPKQMRTKRGTFKSTKTKGN